MGVLRWPSVAMTGTAQTIPAVCPNCMAPADVKYRYAYISPFYFFSRTAYYQSFSYCRRCEPMMDAYFKWRSKGCLIYILYVAAFAGGIGAAAVLFGPRGPLAAVGPAGAVAFVALCVVALWWVLSRLRARAMAKFPLGEGQVAQRPAAYYTGTTLGGLGTKSVYRALRKEWLAALVRANPGSVDAATYTAMVGEPPPSSEGRKPFA